MNYNGKRIAVIGSRTFSTEANKKRLYEVLDANKHQIKLIVSGGARGADTLAQEWAKDNGFPCLVFYPRWTNPDTGEHDRGAGFKRNYLIIKHCDVVLAFWDGASKGTAHSIEMAKEQNKPVKIIEFIPELPKEKETQPITPAPAALPDLPPEDVPF